MDDIEDIVGAADHAEFERKPRIDLLYPVSSLSTGKENLKQHIKREIRFLAKAYISLAAFIPDHEYKYIDAVIMNDRKPNKRIEKRLFKKVLEEMAAQRKVIEKYYDKIY